MEIVLDVDLGECRTFELNVLRRWDRSEYTAVRFYRIPGAAENVVLEITSGGVSGGGSYQALRVACEVASLEQAHHLSALFSKAEGVKFVL